LLEVHTATNQYGGFTAAVPAHLSSFRISISGGTRNGNPFLGHLMADIVLTDPAHQTVVVNPVTTLVSLVRDERPKLKLDDAEALVRGFLKLPADYDLGMALRQSSGYRSRYFSPIALMAEADDTGGLDALEHLLVQELAEVSSTHPFRQPQLFGDTASFIATNLAAGALKAAGGSAAGWAMSQAGLPTPGISSGDINSLVQALQDLTSAIMDLTSAVKALSRQVASSATYTEYLGTYNVAQQYADLINGHEEDLMNFATYCPPLDANSSPAVWNPGSYCVTQFPIVHDELQQEYENKYYESLRSNVQDNATTKTEGMIHLYSLYLGQSKAFFRAADSTVMENLYNYWDQVLTSGANLRMEWFHLLKFQDPASGPGGYGTLTGFMGDPDQNPPTTGSFQADEAANQKLMFPPVPVGTVINTVDHTMWALVPWQPPNGDIYGWWYPAAGCVTNGSPSGGLKLASGYAGYSWNMAPSKAEWQNAVKLAPAGTDWMQFLIDQTKTSSDETPASDGFFNFVKCPHAGWTTDPDSYNSWWAIFPNGQSTFVQAHVGDQNILMPDRTLASGEQYYWYQ
jgi:hypothetical protein